MLVKRTVTITLDDQAKGLQYCASGCPGALAIRRTFPELRAIAVILYTIRYVSPSAACGVVSTPGPLLRYIPDYDGGKWWECPPSFELELDI